MSTCALLFDGETYNPQLDARRLSSQLARVSAVMADGAWRTLDDIAALTGDPSLPAVSARLRDLRKERYGAHVVERRRIGHHSAGLFQYRISK